MLKKLRCKFIALNMAMVAAVLAVVFTAICVINYQQSIGDVYAALNAAIEHDSKTKEPLADIAPPDGTAWKGAPAGGADGEPDLEGSAVGRARDGEGNAPFEIGGKKQDGRFIPVAVYQVGEDGALEAVSDAGTASLADDVLEQAGAALAERSDGSGLLDGVGLYYVKRTNDSGTFLAFADKSSGDGWQTLAWTLAGVGVAALLVFLVISLFFSRWALRPVEAAWTQQKRFVADASHELKTPLTVILANSSIVLEHPERSVASQSQWVESTQTEAERMQQLVGDLLLLAKLDEGDAANAGPSLAHERIDLADLVEGDLLQFESVAFERGVGLESSVEPGVQVRGEASRLHRLTTTLIDNACKYADDGGRVDVTLRKATRKAELVVHNTGLAIADDDLPHVFDRFYRADKARTRDEGGYGLGLAIARAVTEEHDGTIAVTSDAEHGTTFTVTLPLDDC